MTKKLVCVAMLSFALTDSVKARDENLINKSMLLRMPAQVTFTDGVVLPTDNAVGIFFRKDGAKFVNFNQGKNMGVIVLPANESAQFRTKSEIWNATLKITESKLYFSGSYGDNISRQEFDYNVSFSTNHCTATGDFRMIHLQKKAGTDPSVKITGPTTCKIVGGRRLN